ncbi:hypothetical protein BH09SUM1_BH09SUM1_21230 [soil metagenome]
MASPHVAGVMGLLRQKFPSDTVEELKARVMTNSSQSLTTGVNGGGVTIPPQRGGAGRVDVQAAVNATAFAMNTAGDGSVSINFGRVEVLSTATLMRSVKVVNRGAQQRTWNLSYTSAIQQPGVTITLPPSVTVPAHSSNIFNAQVTVNVAQMEKRRDPSMTGYQNSVGYADVGRDFMIEESGFINFASVGAGNSMHLPLYIAPQPAARDTAVPTFYAMPDATGAKDIVLGGSAFDMGPNFPEMDPLDVTPVTSVYEWVGTSPQDPLLTGIFARADVKNFGFSYVPSTTEADIYYGKVTFAVSTWAPWNTTNELAIVVETDKNNDGNPDYQIYNDNLGSYYGDQDNDVPLDITYNFAANSRTGAVYANLGDPRDLDLNRFGTDALALTTYAGFLGLQTGSSTFRMRVRTLYYSLHNPGPSGFSDATPWSPIIDLAATGISTDPIYQTKKAGDTIGTTYNKAALTADGALGIMLLHHHNGAGFRDQTLPFDPPAPESMWMLQ